MKITLPIQEIAERIRVAREMGGRSLLSWTRSRRAPLGEAIWHGVVRARLSHNIGGAPAGGYQFPDYQTTFRKTPHWRSSR